MKNKRGASIAQAALGVALVATFALAAAQSRAEPLPGGADSFENLLESVVRIDVREVSFEQGGRRYVSGVGSGVIVSPDGMILTNAHVVGPRAVEISVTLSSLERVRAELAGWDHWTDLALLRLDMDEVQRRRLSFAYAEFGDSDRLRTGETVYAVGTPHGLERTVTKGIVSNSRRYFSDSRGVRGYETGTFNTWLQTDAAINPGNSGGPLATEDGRVIGINSRRYLGADNLGFAIPSNIAREVMEKLSEHGAVTRSYIGLIPRSLQDLESFFELELNMGMLINNVDPGSPASQAGVRPGDVVLAVNGLAVDGRFPEQLPAILKSIADLPVGSEVRLEIKRGAQILPAVVVTERLESRVGEEWAFELWGLSVRKVSRAFARENQLGDDSGVLVIGAQTGFPAAKSGLGRGDIILKVNHGPIRDLETLKLLYAEFESTRQPLLVEAMRDRRLSLYVINP